VAAGAKQDPRCDEGERTEGHGGRGESTVLSAPMLHLASKTPASWGRWAVEHMDEMLLDHAHCEKKAASTALKLVFKYAHHPSMMVPLSRLAREELSHFEQVIGHLRRRGAEYQRQKPSPYASRLMEIVRPREPEHLIDTLMCSAMIEARSCERMQLVAEGLEALGSDASAFDPQLVELYRGLLASEARHHNTYLELARRLELLDPLAFEKRLRQIAEHEAFVVTDAPTAPRLHNAAPVAYRTLSA
jgi:tRNA 2-(methylsulfanyl)-N6-isopentenyladenosine37 hydroxylase